VKQLKVRRLPSGVNVLTKVLVRGRWQTRVRRSREKKKGHVMWAHRPRDEDSACLGKEREGLSPGVPGGTSLQHLTLPWILNL
jgi:hypothetical protein